MSRTGAEVPESLAGRVALVTGGSKGIGQAICIGLAEAGCAVALTGRGAGDGPGTAGATAARIRQAGGRALPLLCDVRDAAAVSAAVARTVETFGRLDIVVNNAGLFFPGHLLADMEIALWEETLATHLTGSFLCARAALPAMIAGGGGSIVNLSSTAGDPAHDSTANVAYAVAKAGIEQMTRGLAREVRMHDVAVNAIRPMALLSEGSRRTGDWLARFRQRSGANAAPALRDGLSDAERMQGFSPPSAICPAILFLARCRGGFTGNVVRRTDFSGTGFDALVSSIG